MRGVAGGVHGLHGARGQARGRGSGLGNRRTYPGVASRERSTSYASRSAGAPGQCARIQANAWNAVLKPYLRTRDTSERKRVSEREGEGPGEGRRRRRASGPSHDRGVGSDRKRVPTGASPPSGWGRKPGLTSSDTSPDALLEREARRARLDQDQIGHVEAALASVSPTTDRRARAPAPGRRTVKGHLPSRGQ